MVNINLHKARLLSDGIPLPENAMVSRHHSGMYLIYKMPHMDESWKEMVREAGYKFINSWATDTGNGYTYCLYNLNDDITQRAWFKHPGIDTPEKVVILDKRRMPIIEAEQGHLYPSFTGFYEEPEYLVKFDNGAEVWVEKGQLRFIDNYIEPMEDTDEITYG